MRRHLPILILCAAAACFGDDGVLTRATTGPQGPEPGPRTIKSLRLSDSVVSVETGALRNVHVAAYDQRGALMSGIRPSWTTSAPQVATISAAEGSAVAVVSGVSKGTATLTATVDGHTASARIDVHDSRQLAGIWDFTESLVLTQGGGTICADTGSISMAPTGGAMGGLVEVSGMCRRGATGIGNSGSGSLAGGMLRGDSVKFETRRGSQTCRYRGRLQSSGHAMSGMVDCTEYTGAWTAQRERPITSLRIIADDAAEAVLGEVRVLRAELRTSGGAAFLRPIVWSSSNADALKIANTTTSSTVLVTAALAGAGTITAVTGEVSVSYPIVVAALEFTSFAVDWFRSCGSTSDGALYCWDPGQAAPRRKFSGPALTSLSLGVLQGCGISLTGVTHCWPNWGPGQPNQPLPAFDTGLQFTSVTVGGGSEWINYDEDFTYEHMCALTGEGRAYCWGDNNYGQLGQGHSNGRSDHPVPVVTEERFAMLSAGAFHTCGVTVNGRILCWGANRNGELGDGTLTLRSQPVPVAGDETFGAVFASSTHTCALATNGRAWCWGSSAHGKLGIGYEASDLVPALVVGTVVFSGLAVGINHTCGLAESAEVYCWGSNSNRQLGRPAGTSASMVPLLLPTSLKFGSISSNARAFSTCGRASDGRIYCWGSMYPNGPTRLIGQP